MHSNPKHFSVFPTCPLKKTKQNKSAPPPPRPVPTAEAKRQAGGPGSRSPPRPGGPRAVRGSARRPPARPQGQASEGDPHAIAGTSPPRPLPFPRLRGVRGGELSHRNLPLAHFSWHLIFRKSTKWYEESGKRDITG